MAKRRGHGEGSIYQLPDGRWRAAVSLGWQSDDDGKPVWKRKTITKATRAEVQQELTRVLSDARKGRVPAANDCTLGEYFNYWLENEVKVSTRPRTYASYEQTVRTHLVPSLGRKRLSALARPDVQMFIANRLKAGVSPNTLTYCVRVLKIALNSAIANHRLYENVAAHCDLPEVTRREGYALSIEEGQRFFAALAGHRYEALFALILGAGLRRGEALALSFDSFDEHEGVLRVRHTLQRINGQLQRVKPKSKAGVRDVHLPDFVLEALKHHKANRARLRGLGGTDWVETDYLFTSNRGTPLLERNVFRDFKKIVEAAGLGHVHIHDLRHSYVTMMGDQGADEKTVSVMVGHSDIRLTQSIYRHISTDAKRKAATLFPSFATSFATKPGNKNVN